MYIVKPRGLLILLTETELTPSVSASLFKFNQAQELMTQSYLLPKRCQCFIEDLIPQYSAVVFPWHYVPHKLAVTLARKFNSYPVAHPGYSDLIFLTSSFS